MSRRKPKGPLRKGWTTGACATAAARAAYQALLSGDFPDPVSITLPRGERPSFPLSRAILEDGRASAGVIKDAGDDPDVTDGAEIISTVAPGPPGSGVTFAAGEGVGTVTLAGLPVDVGQAAINPAPRRMMTDAVNALAREFGCAPVDVCITVSIPGGEELARRTTNGRLGIKGGLSVLGTTGVVIPYSCASWIHSIHSGVDVCRAAGIGHIAGCTGRTSEDAVRKMHRLPEMACMDLGDFAGGLLKYLRKKPIQRLTIAGGFAKMSKLAAGHLDLHSSRSQVDFHALAAMLADLGAPAGAVERARKAANTGEVLAAAGDYGLGDLVAARAREVALATRAGGTDVEVCVFDRGGRLVGHARP